MTLGSLTGCALGVFVVVTSGCGRADDSLNEVVESEGVFAAPLGEAYSHGRIVRADVVAIDQVFVYNRLGAFNPVGMIYALKRDLEKIDPAKPLGPGNATLRVGKRPRPLVLRANVGDTLEITFTNWLVPDRNDIPGVTPAFHVGAEAHVNDSPATRSASVHINGLQPKDHHALGGNVGSSPSASGAQAPLHVDTSLRSGVGCYLALSDASCLTISLRVRSEFDDVADFGTFHGLPICIRC